MGEIRGPREVGGVCGKTGIWYSKGYERDAVYYVVYIVPLHVSDMDRPLDPLDDERGRLSSTVEAFSYRSHLKNIQNFVYV